MFNLRVLCFIIFSWAGQAIALDSPDILGVDPTKPSGRKADIKLNENTIADKKPSIDVQIISYQPQGKSFAVINDKRFTEGDVFEESTILKIEKNKVILSNPDRKPLVLDYATLSIKKSEGSAP